MAPLPPVASVIELQLKMIDGSDNDILTRTYWEYSGGPPSPGGLSTMASTLSTNWGSTMKSYFTTGVSLVEVVITDLTSSTSARGLWSGNIAGTRSGDSIAAQVAMLVNYSVARRYRGGKPRNYFPAGVYSDVLNPQEWVAAFTSGFQSAWITFLGDVAAAAPSGTTIVDQVNVSYFDGFTVVTNPITGRARNVPKLRATPAIDAVTAVTASGVFATQRRRTGRKR